MRIHSNLLKSIFLSLVVGAVTLQAAADVKVNGFVDAHVSWQSPQAAIEGFFVNDGAIYMSADMGGTKAMIDIPFNFGGAANTFAVGTRKAQAYVEHSYDNGASWQLGQFDSLFGLEGIDTKDVTFSTAGMIRGGAPVAGAGAAILPTTHTGIAVGYKMQGAWIKALVANQNALGSNGNLPLDYGVVVGADMDMLRAKAGFILRKSAAGNTDWLADAVVGTTFGPLTADIEFVLRQPRLISAAAGTGFGVLGHFVYAATDQINFSARAEFLSKLGALQAASGLPTNSTLGFTVGPQFMMNEHLTVKIDYTLNSLTAVSGGTSATTHIGTLAAVASL